MFPGNVRLYVYPSVIPGKGIDGYTGIKIDPDMKYLYEHLLATKQIVDIKHFKQEF